MLLDFYLAVPTAGVTLKGDTSPSKLQRCGCQSDNFQGHGEHETCSDVMFQPCIYTPHLQQKRHGADRDDLLNFHRPPQDMSGLFNFSPRRTRH